MKRLALFLFSVLASYAWAATPTYYSFDTNDFAVVPSLTAPEKIQSRWHNTNGTVTVSNTVVFYTNSPVFINGTSVATINPTDGRIPYRTGTNSFGDSPLVVASTTDVLGDTMLLVNLTAITKLQSSGAFKTTSSTIDNLVPGPNNLTLTNRAILYLVSTNTNSLVHLDSGNGAGSHIWMVNSGTTGFSLPSDVLTDNPAKAVWVRGGAWSPTELGESLELLGVAGGWVEIGRANPSSGSTNVVTDLLWAYVNGLLYPTVAATNSNIGVFAGGNQSLTNSANVHNRGSYAGYNQVLSNMASVFNYGASAGEGQDYADGHDIYFYGMYPGYNSYGRSAGPVFGIGWQAGANSTNLHSAAVFYSGYYGGSHAYVSNSSSVFMGGHAGGSASRVEDSYDIYFDGYFGGANSSANNSHAIYAPQGGLQNSALTNSANILALSQDAGNGVSGSLTNVVFVGKDSSAADGSANQVVLGPAMSLIQGTNTIIDKIPNWTGSGTNWLGDDGKYHSTTFNTNGGNMSGSLSAPYLPYATGTDTLADSPMSRLDVNTVTVPTLLSTTLTNTGDITLTNIVYTFPSKVGSGEFLTAASAIVPGMGSYYRAVLEWSGGPTNAVNNFYTTNLYTTNLYTSNFYGGDTYTTNLYVTNITVENIYVTNGPVIINGTNVATINPTDNKIPVRIGTNTFGDSPLTVSGADVLASAEILAPTLAATSTLQTAGNFVTSAKTLALLTVTSNNLALDGKALVYLYSNDAASNRLVYLDTGHATGQHVWLMNTSTNFGFTINAGPLTDDTNQMVWLRGNSWVPTENGETLELVKASNGWVEVNRANPNSGPPVTTTTATNYFVAPGSNITVVTNITGTNVTWTISSTGGGGGSSIWTNESSTVHLITTNANSKLVLSADNGGGSGTTEFWNTGSKRWTMADAGTFYPANPTDIGTSLNPVQTLWLQDSTGVMFGDRKVFAGTSAPEGIRTAKIGSIYMQEDGAPGYTLWTKTNGTGTTGWATVTYPWYNVAATNAGIDGKILFGPGATNALYRDGGYLVYTNGQTSVQFQIKSPTDGLNLEANNGFSQISSASGLLLAASTTTINIDGIGMYPGSSPVKLGKAGSPWGEIITGPANDGSNYDILSLSHDGNNPIINSVSVGTHSPAKDLLISSNNYPVAAIQMNGQLRLPISHTPASSSETNYVGAMTWDANYIYVWTATNVNKRATLNSW